ncbi:hypothetical protein V1514DRAFT_332536 [Lipomyces japonicus]|uniref:uncharacterized protein n=1 Tax=Lipomyces japonicus TaxID=56871 RepID=UPI0034CE0E8C
MSTRSIRPIGRCIKPSQNVLRTLGNFKINNQIVRHNSSNSNNEPNPRNFKFRTEFLNEKLNDFGKLRISSQQQFLSSEVGKSSSLVALHARIGLPKSFTLAALARTLNCRTSEFSKTFPNNKGLSELGHRLLDYYVTEWVVTQYPRLPIAIIKEVGWAFAGPEALKNVGEGWGVDPDLSVNEYGVSIPTPLPEAYGLLKYGKIIKRTKGSLTEYNVRGEAPMQTYSTAMAEFVQAVVAGINVFEGRAAAKKFIRDHILSRHVDITKLFEFDEPTVLLSRLCSREFLVQPVSRMIAETGRLTKSPVFVIGIYSGSNLLGSGEGSSIKEAEFRAAIGALKAWYLYSPANTSLPSSAEDSDREFKPNYIDVGEIIV